MNPPAGTGGDWAVTVLHNFTGSDGLLPSAGVIAGGGVLYGATYDSYPGEGTVFSLAP